jgi:hypothetical protein
VYAAALQEACSTLANRRPEPFMGVRDHQLDPRKSSGRLGAVSSAQAAGLQSGLPLPAVTVPPSEPQSAELWGVGRSYYNATTACLSRLYDHRHYARHNRRRHHCVDCAHAVGSTVTAAAAHAPSGY